MSSRDEPGLAAEIIGGIVVSFVGAGLTTFIADGFCHQHWNFWPVLGAWALLVFLGVTWFEVSDGDFDL
jgi:hypothetical protein